MLDLLGGDAPGYQRRFALGGPRRIVSFGESAQLAHRSHQEVMMIRAARRFVVAAVCATAALPLAAAAATPPVVEVIPYEATEVVAPGELLGFDANPCPFTVTLHHQGTFVYRTFFDRNGTPIRQLVRSAGFTETYSANGRSLTTVSVAPVHLEATGGEVSGITGTGNLRHLIVPGVGPVLAQAGRFTIDPNTGGVTAVYGLNIPPGSEFCTALSG